MSIKQMQRQRDTSSVQRRAENMRNLIAKLKESPMTGEEIGHFLEFSASGTRKYIKDLRDCSVIEFSHYAGSFDKFIGYHVWRLSSNMDARKAFLDALSIPARRRGPALAKHKPLSGDPTRHFHVMQDDVHYAIRVNRTPARRDDLVSALFGPALHQPESK